MSIESEYRVDPRQKRALQVGFVGGGINSAVGYTHFLASRLDALFHVASGCFSRNSEINRQTASQFGVPISRCYHSIEEFLQAEADSLDAICILTPTPNHAENVTAALNAGCDVICEKAMATSVSEGKLIQDAERESGRKLMVTFNYVGYPMVREARAIIASGGIGRPQQVYCEMPQESFSRTEASPQAWRRRDYEIPCVSLDLGVHVHHLVYYLTGFNKYKSISAIENSFGKVSGVIDTVCCVGQNQSGMVNLMWSKSALGYANGLRFRIFGESGSLEWCQANPELLVFCDELGERRILERGQRGLLEANRPVYNRFKAGHPAGFVEAFANIYGDFSQILHNDGDEKLQIFNSSIAKQGLDFLSAIHEIAG